MANTDDCEVDENSYNSMRLPSHGSLPKWLENMSKSVIQNCSSETPIKKKQYQIVDLNALKDATEIPSRISGLESSTLEKRYTRQSGKSPKFGRSSFAAQVYSRGIPRQMTLTDSDYLIPRLDQKTDYATLCSDGEQSDLERSWKSLYNFEQTHKGRLDSATQQNNKKAGKWNVIMPPITSSEIVLGSCYSPSFLEKHILPERSKSEMSHYVEPNYCSPISNGRKSNENILSTSLNDLCISNSQSSGNFFYLLPKEDLAVERHITDYRLKVDEENQLRDKIINELFNENERITERIKLKNVRKRYEQKYSPHISYDDSAVHNKKWHNENIPFKLAMDPAKTNYEKDNLIEYFMEGNQSTFVIPELPTGKILSFKILNTWGDKHYVGLNGIEIFGSDGKIVDAKKISANPSDVNILPENKNDPRVVTNLLDGVNRTQDDVHLWLTPFQHGRKHTITVHLRNVTTIAMIRIWNYNKSRIHSFRGVRNMIITLDDVPVFRGEIAKACGGVLGGVDAFGDTILFTTDESILQHISVNDNSYSTLTKSLNSDISVITERPPTAATRTSRPYTGVPQHDSDIPDSVDEILHGSYHVKLVLLSNWGYANVIGITGIEILGPSYDVIPITEENISCNSEIQTLNLKALINGKNVTTEIENMCWFPFKPGEEIVITIQFHTYTYMSGLRIWNYNQSPETTYLGVQSMHIHLDNIPLMNYILSDHLYLLRRAPGNTHYDFAQEVMFTNNSRSKEEILPVNNVSASLSLYKSEMPEGFVFQFIIFSTWGDQYYCGLNEIELYDECGVKLNLNEHNICAYPESINILPSVSGDIRTPDKLIDGVPDDIDGAHSWLAPIIPKCLNRLYIVLDQPITISMIKLWNYSKTPSRGIKEFSVLVDDLLVYSGALDKYMKRKGASYRSILFTGDKSIIEKEANTYIRHSSYIQDVVLFDENRTTTGGSLPNADQSLRPFTSVSPFERGYISQ